MECSHAPEQQAALVADYFARGGTVKRLPQPDPFGASKVVEFLQDCNFDVQVTTKDGQTQYVYKNAVVSLKRLVAIANRSRARRRLLPFQIDDPLH